MKKILLVPLIVMISLLLTACTAKTGQQGSAGDENAATTSSGDEEESINGNILDLAGLGKKVKCTYAYDNENMSMSGVVYVSGSKTRSDATIKMSDGTENSMSTITDGEWMYMWTSESQQGTKMNLQEMKQTADEYKTDEGNGQTNQYRNQTQDVDYKCRPWIVDNSKFDIPSDVNFIDMNEMMKGIIDMGKGMNLGN